MHKEYIFIWKVKKDKTNVQSVGIYFISQEIEMHVEEFTDAIILYQYIFVHPNEYRSLHLNNVLVWK